MFKCSVNALIHSLSGDLQHLANIQPSPLCHDFELGMGKSFFQLTVLFFEFRPLRSFGISTLTIFVWDDGLEYSFIQL
jgi:hypothetical protein